MAGDTRPSRNVLTRLLWLVSGLIAVGLGGLGIIIPGLPTTGFFILAAWCFSKSSPRLEAWVLGLPAIGPMVSDYRSGLGMPRRAKAWAIGMMVAFGLGGAIFLIEAPTVRVIVVIAVAAGCYWVGIRVPTTETVRAERSGDQLP